MKTQPAYRRGSELIWRTAPLVLAFGAAISYERHVWEGFLGTLLTLFAVGLQHFVVSDSYWLGYTASRRALNPEVTNFAHVGTPQSRDPRKPTDSLYL